MLLGVRDLAEEDVSNKIKHLGLMPLRQRELQTIPSRSRLIKGLAFFLLSIFLVSFNYLSAAPAFLLCVLGFARIRIIDSDFYRKIDFFSDFFLIPGVRRAIFRNFPQKKS